MANPRLCCLRIAPALRTSAYSTYRHASSTTLAQRSLHTAAPLHLDFLAPAWPAMTTRHTTAPPLASNGQRRSWSSTRPNSARAVQNPRKDDDGLEMGITITPRAAHRLQSIAEKDGNPDLTLRVSVESGGCHGFQYLMSLVNTSDVDPTEDTLFEDEAQRTGDFKAKVVMDGPSLELLKGSHIDYTMELIGSQFKVTGIPGAKSSCGCGTSFDIAA